MILERPYRVAETYDPMSAGHFPYGRVASVFAARLEDHGVPGERIGDLGCGTGNLTLPLAALGYRMTGIDRSPDMLAIARAKARERGLEMQLRCADLERTWGRSCVDGAVCFFGVLNFLRSAEALRSGLAAVAAALRPGGLLVFDFAPPEILRRMFGGTQVRDYGAFEAVVQSTVDGSGTEVDHRVTFFLREADGRFRRERERHRLRLHAAAELARALDEAALELVAREPMTRHLDAPALAHLELWVARRRP